MKQKKLFPIIALALIGIISIFLRFYNLGTPNEQVFDEVYFPVFAQNYNTQTDFFDSHPPLGKLIIAQSIQLAGNNPVGWRLFNAITGVLLLVVIFGFTYDLTHRLEPSILATFLVAVDPMALVESRVGLINIYLAIFSLAGLWFFWRWWKSKEHTLRDYTLAVAFFAAAGAVKWIGLGAFAAALLFFVLHRWPKDVRPHLRWHHFALLLLIPAIYLLSFLPDLAMRDHLWKSSLFDYLKWWHENAFGYHAHLNATHPYGSDWWTWPFNIRPLWLFFKSPSPGIITGIIEIGNVVTWIAGLFAVVWASRSWFLAKMKRTISDKEQRLAFLIITYLALYIPWSVISRVKFIYHYFVPALVLLILLAIVLDEDILSKKELRPWGIALLCLSGLFFLYFLPLLLGSPISESFYRHHIWLQSWI